MRGDVNYLSKMTLSKMERLTRHVLEQTFCMTDINNMIFFIFFIWIYPVLNRNTNTVFSDRKKFRAKRFLLFYVLLLKIENERWKLLLIAVSGVLLEKWKEMKIDKWIKLLKFSATLGLGWHLNSQYIAQLEYIFAFRKSSKKCTEI